MSIFRFKLQGREYQFDDDRMSLPEAIWIKKQTGMVGAELFNGFRIMDPEALACIYALALRRDGMVINNLEDLPLDPENGYVELIEGVVGTDEEPEEQPNRRTRRTKAKAN